MAIDRSLYCHLPTRGQFHARFLRQAQKSRFADRVQRGVKTNCWHTRALIHGHLVLHSYDRTLTAEQMREVRTCARTLFWPRGRGHRLVGIEVSSASSGSDHGRRALEHSDHLRRVPSSNAAITVWEHDHFDEL